MHRLKVVHRDLKSANIMLDVAANVKLSAYLIKKIF